MVIILLLEVSECSLIIFAALAPITVGPMVVAQYIFIE